MKMTLGSAAGFESTCSELTACALRSWAVVSISSLMMGSLKEARVSFTTLNGSEVKPHDPTRSLVGLQDAGLRHVLVLLDRELEQLGQVRRPLRRDRCGDRGGAHQSVLGPAALFYPGNAAGREVCFGEKGS